MKAMKLPGMAAARSENVRAVNLLCTMKLPGMAEPGGGGYESFAAAYI